MQIKDLGEFGTIDIINKLVSSNRASSRPVSQSARNILVDTGDDTAAWSPYETTELITTDTVVQGTHFTLDTISWHDLGWKSLAANISDIASMGGSPSYAVITLGLPGTTDISDIKELYRGIFSIADQYGVSIVGGDMVRAKEAFITIALTGSIHKTPLMRTTASSGDLIAVSGYIGSSAGGLKLIQENPVVSEEASQYLIEMHRQPIPQIATGQLILDYGLTTGMDISDGLSDDLAKLCLASGVSANLHIDQIPINTLLKITFPNEYIDLALYGGEDYHILFTGTPDKVAQVITKMSDGAAIIGEITRGDPGQVTLVYPNGERTVSSRKGWDHFR
jgi:thiamine-monophosphate kinase